MGEIIVYHAEADPQVSSLLVYYFWCLHKTTLKIFDWLFWSLFQISNKFFEIFQTNQSVHVINDGILKKRVNLKRRHRSHIGTVDGTNI